MHTLLLCHALVGAVLCFLARFELGVLIAPDLFLVFPYAQKNFDLAKVQDRAMRRLRCLFALHCLVTGFVHIYHAEHLRLLALREAAMSQPVPYGCANNWDWDKLTLSERVRDTVFTDTVQRCAEYLRLTTIDVYPNALVVLIDTLVLAPLRAVDAVADTVGSAVAHFLSHFTWLLQLLLVAAVPVALLAACWFLPSAAAAVSTARNQHLQLPEAAPHQALLIEEIEDEW